MIRPANVSIAISQPGPLLRFHDPEVGDTLSVVTAPLPARGFLRPQNFVEFSLLELVQGVAVSTNSDDVGVEHIRTRSLSAAPAIDAVFVERIVRPMGAPGGAVFDPAEWTKNQKARFIPRLDELMNAASAAPDEGVFAANLALGKFYLARGFYQEAKGALDLALVKPQAQEGIKPVLMARAVAEILAGRIEPALKDLNNPAIAGPSIPNCGRDLQARVRKNGPMRGRSSRTSNPGSSRCRSICSGSSWSRRCGPAGSQRLLRRRRA